MNHNRSYASKGFTIVELLIVIVIIAILATITVVTYNGIQQRAKHTNTISVAQSYVKLLSGYYAINGNYPVDVYACLGENNPDINNDGSAGDCFYANDVKKENATMLAGLKTITSSTLPIVTEVGVNGTKFHGIVFVATNNLTLNGQPWRYWLTYMMEGSNAECGVRPLANADGYPNFVTANATRKYSGTTDNGVECWIPLTAT